MSLISISNEIVSYISKEYNVKINKNKIKEILTAKLNLPHPGFLKKNFQVSSPILKKQNLPDDTWIIHNKISQFKNSTSELSNFNILWSLKPIEKEPLIIYGKPVYTPRYVKQYLRDYKFSGIVHKGNQLNENILGEKFLLDLLKYIKNISKKEYNGILVNWYTDGNDYIGYHSDDESELVKDSEIYSITFGATRDFYLKHKTTNKVYKYKLENNDLIVMGGKCQTYYKHSVPKRLKCNKPRINITFRLYK